MGRSNSSAIFDEKYCSNLVFWLGQPRPLFVYIFVLFKKNVTEKIEDSSGIQTPIVREDNRSLCLGYKSGLQDGSRRRNHGAMAATIRGYCYCLKIILIAKALGGEYVAY